GRNELNPSDRCLAATGVVQHSWKGAAMSDTMQTPQPSASREERPRRRFFRRAAIAAALAAVAAGIGARALAQGGGHWGGHRAGFMGDQLDSAKLEEHLDRMLRHLYVEVDATDAQRLQLAPIVKSAARDLLPVRTKIHEARRQAVQLLSQDPVDRAALEALRTEQLQLIEQASRRLTQALADVADVLTPEQRQALAARIGRCHRHHRAT